MDTRQIYIEHDGVVSIEAEAFYSRSPSTTSNGFFVSPDEGSTQTIGGGAFDIVGANDNTVVQSSVSGAPGANPSLLYRMYISTAGTYRIYVRGVATTATADTAFVSIVELADGIGVGNPDYWYC